MEKSFLCRRIVVLFFVFCSCYVCYSSNKHDVNIAVTISKYQHIMPEELLHKADSFASKNINDSAMICYSLIYNNYAKYNDVLLKRVVCRALNKAAIIYFYKSDYTNALELLLKALTICEEISYDDYIGRVYNNVGNVYFQFKDYKQAKKYYKLANMNGGYDKGALLSNLGAIAYNDNDLDSALLLFKNSYLVKCETKDSNYNATLNNIGLVYQKLNMSDSAFFYYKAAVNNAEQLRDKEGVALALSNIGLLYFDTQRYDSATYYLHLSNKIADELKLFAILSSNYLFLSKIEEFNGDIRSSFELYKKYSMIKDSIFDASKYAAVTELQFNYNMLKTDEQIRELNVEREIKSRTIIMQRRFQVVMGLILVIVIVFLILLYVKNRTLNKAYNVLFDKNIEIVNSDKLNEQMKIDYENELDKKKQLIEKLRYELSHGGRVEESDDLMDTNKSKRHSISDDSQTELMNAILDVMNDKSVYCDADFSLEKLAAMINTNRTYLSRVINDSFGNNFKTFINGYRIKEARKMLSDSEYKKYSIESISIMVGFKSKSQFNIIFKEITGVTPSFYIKSLKRE